MQNINEIASSCPPKDSSTPTKVHTIPIENGFFPFLKHKLIIAYNFKYFKSITFGIINILLAILCSNLKVPVVYTTTNSESDVNISSFMLIMAFSSTSYIFISLIIHSSSTYIQNKMKGFSHIIYTVNEITSSITILIILTTILFYSYANGKNMRISPLIFESELDTHIILVLFIIGVSAIGLMQACVNKISFNFNRDTFIERMLNVFRVEYFFKLIALAQKVKREDNNNNRNSNSSKHNNSNSSNRNNNNTRNNSNNSNSNSNRNNSNNHSLNSNRNSNSSNSNISPNSNTRNNSMRNSNSNSSNSNGNYSNSSNNSNITGNNSIILNSDNIIDINNYSNIHITDINNNSNINNLNISNSDNITDINNYSNINNSNINNFNLNSNFNTDNLNPNINTDNFNILNNPNRNLWLEAFPWFRSDNSKTTKSKLDEYERRKKLFFDVKDDQFTPELRSWIYKEFKKLPKNVKYTSYLTNVQIIKNKKSEEKVEQMESRNKELRDKKNKNSRDKKNKHKKSKDKSVFTNFRDSFLSKKSALRRNLSLISDNNSDDKRNYIKTAGDLKEFFKDQKTFTDFCLMLGFTDCTELNEDFLNTMYNRNKTEIYNIQNSTEQINVCLKRIRTACILIVISVLLIYTTIASYGKTPTIYIVASTFFGTGFAFQPSVKKAVDSVLFLLCIHPYDVGDRIFVSLDDHMENMVVKELNVFSTVFVKFDGTLSIVSNSELRTKQITNVRRSGSMAETYKIFLNSSVKTEKLADLRSQIIGYAQSRPYEFSGSVMLNIETLRDANKIFVKVYVQYKRNWNDYYHYLEEKNELMMFIAKKLKFLQMEYVLPTQPVNIISMENI